MSGDASRIFDPRLLAEFEALVGREGEVARLRPSGSFDRAALVTGRPLAPLPRLRDGALVAEFAGLAGALAPSTGRSTNEPVAMASAPLRLLCISAHPSRALWLADDAPPDGTLRTAPEIVDRASAAIRRLDGERFDAIVLDLGGRRTRGLEAIGRLHERAPETPILVIGPRGDEDLAVAAVRAGAQDYLAAGAASHADVLRAARCAIERLSQQNTLRGMSLVDELTGLYNRRGFYTLARQHEKLAGRLRTRMLYVFLDLDGLKQINDTLGHREGDVALVETATLLRKTFRESDVVARLGGDEFAVLALEIGGRSADTWRQRLDANLDALNAGWSRGYRLALSLGVATYDPRFPRSMEDLLAQADAEMYAAKRAKGAERRPLATADATHRTSAPRGIDRFDAAEADRTGAR
jgi:diguanylate cyclase (GGDEF)-like protein